MKRETFVVTSTAGHSITKHAWNSANREVEAIIREIARNEGCIYELVDRESNKAGFYYTHGSRTWLGRNANKIVFSIQRL